MREFRTRLDQLPNGVRTLEISIPGSELTSVSAHVLAGSRNDVYPMAGQANFAMHALAGKLGNAHGTEHALFKGTHTKSERQINIQADSLPADWSAFTEEERTVYYLDMLNSRAGAGIALLGEVLATPSFPAHAVGMEMGVILQEIYNYRDDPPATVLEMWKALLYHGSSLATPILGTEESVRSLTAADLRGFYDRFYTGPNILVTIAGKVRGLRGDVRSAFGQISPGNGQEFQGRAAYGEPGTAVMTDHAEQAHFVIGVPGVALDDPRYYPLRIIESLLGGHCVTDLSISIPSSRIYDATRVRSGTAYEVSTRLSAGTDTGHLAVQGIVEPRYMATTLDIVKDEMLRLADTVSLEEFERARGFWELYYLKKMSGSLNLALLMSEPALFFGTVVQPAEIIRRIQSVTLDEVRAVAHDFLRESELRLAVLGPFDQNLHVTRDEESQSAGPLYVGTSTLDTTVHAPFPRNALT